MENIAIYGAGGFGREVVCLLKSINEIAKLWNFIGFFDDSKEKESTNEYGEILGGLDVLNAHNAPLNLVMAIGSPHGVSKLVKRINNPNIKFPNIMAPDFRFADKDSVSLGIGNIFSWGCHLSCNVHLGDFNVFNGGIIVGHDAIIGCHNSFMPGVKISGETVIGNENYFGVDSVVLQKQKIGFGTVIGAGSIIIRKTKDNSTYIGNPAKIVKY